MCVLLLCRVIFFRENILLLNCFVVAPILRNVLFFLGSNYGALEFNTLIYVDDEMLYYYSFMGNLWSNNENVRLVSLLNELKDFRIPPFSVFWLMRNF